MPHVDSESTASTAALGKALHILLVEDHTDSADALASLLRSWGHFVTVVRSVTAALAAAHNAYREAEGIDVVISDIYLRDGSGWDLMRDLTQRYRLRGIALTGAPQAEIARRSREAGFEQHFVKPVDVPALEAYLREVAIGG
jgi:CheY-like chemotaxis protein